MIKYTLKNNCQAQLLTPINATDTTLVLQTGQGWKMPTSFPFLLVLEKIVSWITTFREIIKVTNRTWDILTIVRSAWTCLPNDSSNTPWTTAFAFAYWDYVTLAVLSEIIEDIQNEFNTKQNNCIMLTKSANYTFTWAEANNTWFSTNTTSWNITYTLNPTLFPTTNGMYEFTICKSTNDVNTVIIDVWAWKTIDTAQTYILTNYMESVTIRIASSTFVKVIATTNRTVVIAPIPATQSTFIAWENITAWDALRNWSNVMSTLTWSILNTTSSQSQVFWNSTADFEKVWQEFFINTTPNLYLQEIRIKLFKTGSPTDNVQVKIYQSNKTTLVATSTNTISWTTITGSEAEYTFIFNNILLTNSTTYFFEISRTWSMDVSNYYNTRESNSSNYWNWVWAYYRSWAWNNLTASVDITFSIYLWNLLWETTTSLYKTDSSDVRKINFIWFAINTATTWNNVIVDTSWISTTQSSLSAWLDYYLSNTPWAISTTPWTNVKYIWTAVSSTWIQLRDTWLNWTLWNTATTWSVTLWNAVWYVTTSVNWLTVKIPYYS